jgi:hypothetical protein
MSGAVKVEIRPCNDLRGVSGMNSSKHTGYVTNLCATLKPRHSTSTGEGGGT